MRTVLIILERINSSLLHCKILIVLASKISLKCVLLKGLKRTKKVDRMKCCLSELYNLTYPRSQINVKSLSMTKSSTISLKYADSLKLFLKKCNNGF